MMKDALVLLLLTISVALASAQNQEKEPVWAFKFQDYAVKNIFQGKPAPPILISKSQRMYRTMIREGAAKGPNFAGHYTIAQWGCGSACASIVVVDAVSGRVYDAPFGWISMARENEHGPIYQLKSRLFIADGCLNEEDRKCGTHYYEWKDNKFVLLRFDPAPTGK
jgi:hypothetical protein